MSDTIDDELRRMLDEGDRHPTSSPVDPATRLMVLIFGFSMAGLCLLAALVVLVAGGGG